ncbi:aldo/keto reductase [Pseudolysinimonas kribbensis]|uniref:Aldo/keto reductase n=1 Tax=Pseudolysinimonas kribbensis TaxID=433641 RepID=A0ABQ6K8R2_9MICO|nr:aldo/keto reductase [Pseudolysinimonas kribbensis]GMA95928.1 aldo/keto reductase [Pseudolysinimonas kribbensis]
MSEPRRARLGRTDMEITRVGFGAWAIGGGGWANAWGAQDDDESVAAIRHAVERGVNWIDTAAIYGHGHSEDMTARALKDIPEADRPLVFTKGGLGWNDEDHMEASRRRGDPASIRQDVEDSLRRLGVERIDLFQMHWPADDGSEVEDYWNMFAQLKEAGKLRAIGLSNHGIPALERAEAIAHVDSLQPPFSAIRPDAATDGLLDWCADHETGVIVYSPMGSGLLTGAMTAERVAAMPDDDWRRRSPEFTTHLDRNLATGAALARVAERHGVSQASAAVAWTLGFRGVTAAIVGARTPAQIDGWIDGGSVELTAEDYADVGSAIPRA